MTTLPLTDTERASEQSDFLQTMLNGAINGVLLLEPIWNEAAEITDFIVLAANRAVKEMTGVESATAVGKMMGSLFPAYKAGGFFQMYCDVMADGEARRAEFLYADDRLKGWFDVSVVRQGRGVVLTFTNTTAAKEANRLAQEAADNLQQVIDFSQTGIFVLNPVFDAEGKPIDFRYKAVNRMVAGLISRTPDELRGGVVSRWFPRYYDMGLFARYERTYATGETQRFEISLPVAGFELWLDVQCARQNNEVLVTYTDITPLKKAQQAIEWQSQQNRIQADLLNQVLDSSSSGIMAFEAIRDPAQQNRIVDFRFIMANQACADMLEKPVRQMIGRTLLRVFPGNKASGLFDAYVRTTETGESFRNETHYKYDGLDFWLAISAQKSGDGFVVTFADITALKQATRIARESAAQLQTVIDTAQTGIFMLVPVRDASETVVDFRFQTANRVLASYAGQVPENVVGELASRWFPDYKQNGLFDLYLDAFETGETKRFDFHYQGGDIDAWVDVLVTKSGEALLITFTDYTPLKKLQHELENSVVELQRSNENLQQFAYVASHDLQEPLRKILAFGDLLKKTYGEPLGEGNDLISRMQAAAGRMSNLIRDLLAYSRLSTHRDPLKPTPLTGVLLRVLEDLDLAVAEAGASIHYDELPTVTGDPLQLQQLFQNLISNALKFRREGVPPVITLSVEEVAHKDLPAGVQPMRRAPAYYAIAISDNGIGFDEQYRERIFQVFQRLHGKQQYAGTGIGLSIVQRVAENHGGAVAAEGKVNKGATFTVYLPV